MMLYKDQIEKIKYYKKRISTDLMKKGIYPHKDLIDKKLQNIDSMLSIFQFIEAKEGDLFDTHKFNEDLHRIYLDLLYLYKLTYILTFDEYKKLKDYTELHLTELENLARKYEYKTMFEINSTSLGETILFQTNGYNISYLNGMAIIDLGTIKVSKESKLSFVFDCHGVEDKNVIFTVGNQNCLPYSYNYDSITIPGPANKKVHNYIAPVDLKTNQICVINLDSINIKNKYIIYAGKNSIKNNVNNNITFISLKDDNSFIMEDDIGKVSFYVLNGTYIQFDYNKKPLSKNFNGEKIENMSNYQYIEIEYDKDFVFNFVTDGIIYSDREKGLFTQDKLYYPNAYDFNEYLVEEYSADNDVELPAKVTVLDYFDNDLRISAIAIKELNILSEVK